MNKNIYLFLLTTFVAACFFNSCARESGVIDGKKCEKWGYVVDGGRIAIPIALYTKACSDLKDKKIDENTFKKITSENIKKIELIQKELKEKITCPDEEEKYLKRKSQMEKGIMIALPIMAAGGYLGPSVIKLLKNDESDVKKDKQNSVKQGNVEKTHIVEENPDDSP